MTNARAIVPTNNATDDGDVLLVRKPRGWTSFDVVKKVRRILRVRKAGHAGTLDPLATGLLIVGTNGKTKVLDQFQSLEKEYLVTMKLGARTESFDSETPLIDLQEEVTISKEQLNTVLPGFLGEQLQVPPMYSAVKLNGKPLYKYARKGKTVDRSQRLVCIRSIDVVDWSPPEVVLNIVCSKGTYVRTLVNDIGLQLGCGAYMTALERVRIGEYRLDQAVSLGELSPATHQRAHA
jgi:tRNA pseudouridine55 synthase